MSRLLIAMFRSRTRSGEAEEAEPGGLPDPQWRAYIEGAIRETEAWMKGGSNVVRPRPR